MVSINILIYLLTNILECGKVWSMNTFYALNRRNKTAVLLNGFTCWEQVQGAFRSGILMPDNSMADAIGRCASEKQFKARAEFGEWSVLDYVDYTLADPVATKEQI